MKLEDAIVQQYGEQCKPYMEQITKRIAATIAATLYAGEVGDNPLCQLNRMFNELDK